MKTVELQVGDSIKFHGDTFVLHKAVWPGKDGELRLDAIQEGFVINGGLIPFDLAAAKAGAPLVTRDGRKAHYVAYCDKATTFKVCAIIEGQATMGTWTDDGRFVGDPKEQNRADLFMAPKPKRTVWANTYYHATEQEARTMASRRTDLVAVPVEIEE